MDKIHYKVKIIYLDLQKCDKSLKIKRKKNFFSPFLKSFFCGDPEPFFRRREHAGLDGSEGDRSVDCDCIYRNRCGYVP